MRRDGIIAIALLSMLTACGGGSGDVPQSSWYKPAVVTTWQWQLSGSVNTAYAVDLYDIDLFDSDSSLIETLHTQGKKVICYFSAGSYESWRPDSSAFPAEVLGSEMDGWDELWLDIRSDALKPVMLARLDLAKAKGCDGVEPDNVDGYSNDTGFPLSASDQLLYNRYLATEAHHRGLSIGLKNDLDQVATLEPYFDFALNEECHAYDECTLLEPFIDADKPVFNAEYAERYVEDTDHAREALCQKAQTIGLQTLVLPLDLDDSFRYNCP